MATAAIVWLPWHSRAALVLLLAACLDFLIGDPWGWPHPVRGMGWVIDRYTEMVLRFWKSPRLQAWAGVGLFLLLVGGSGVVGWGIVVACNWVHPLFGLGVEGVLLASCFAGRSLRQAALTVLNPLQEADLTTARSQLALYVGRDTAHLTKAEILRAVLETVTENATDGVLAPLFYAVMGAFLPGIGSVPLALAYKAASTLDSMVGYREAPFTHLGRFSAQMEDGLTWLPCRLVVFSLALFSGKPYQVWTICRRDGPKDPSPNSGWSEAAYAAVLQVQVGGTNYYQGVAKHKPLLGEPIRPITAQRVEQALALNRTLFLIWLGLALVGLMASTGTISQRY